MEDLLKEYKATSRYVTSLVNEFSHISHNDLNDRQLMLKNIQTDMRWMVTYITHMRVPASKRPNNPNNRLLFVDPFVIQRYQPELNLFTPFVEKDELDEQYEEDIIRSCLSVLTKRQCVVYKLRHVQMLTWIQIANELGISESSARTHVRRAQERIDNYIASNKIKRHLI